MKKLLLISLLASICLFFTAPHNAEAQKNEVDIEKIRETLPKMLGANNAGKEFWLTVPPCYEVAGQDNFVKIYITSPVKTLVTCEVPGKGYYRTQYTIPNDVILFDISPSQAQPYTKAWEDPEMPAKVWSGAGVHIFAEQPLVVYLVVRYQATSDGFLGLPVSSLGKEYIIAGESVDPMWTNNQRSFPNTCGIVATQDQTRVTFTLGGTTLTKTASGLTPGQSMTTQLMEGDVWMFSTEGALSDLTGSKVMATKPVGVVTGNMCNNIPDGNQWCDYTVEMDIPTFTWGLDYHVPQVPGRLYPSLIRVFAKEGDTDIFRNGNHVGHVKESGGVKGKGWQEMRLVPMGWEPQSAVISGDKPIGVTLYNTGVQEDGYPLPNSDPFVMVMTPYQQYQTEITFATPGIRGGKNFPENYINLVYQAGENGTMPTDMEFAEVRNGRFVWEELRTKFPGVDESFPYDVDNKPYKKKTITLEGDGVYKIRANNPFAAYSFGYGWCDSYGFPTSAALADLSKPDTVCPLPIYELDCLGYIEGATVTDRPEDDAIRTNLSMIVFHSDSSYNFEFEYNDFVPGEAETTSWRAEVRDKSKDARAIITFMDRRGNDTTIVINYNAVEIAIHPEEYDFGMLRVGEQKEADFWAVNLTEEEAVVIEKLEMKFGNEGFEVLDLKPEFPIPANDSLKFRVRFTATEEGEFRDSVLMEDTCYHMAAALVEAAVGEPIIHVTDIDFGDVTVGETITKQANIRNTGSVNLTITGYTGPTESVYIPVLDAYSEQNPLVIKPNSPPFVFDVRFTPDDEREYPDAIYFLNDATREDSVCLLNGRGIRAALVATSLEWPRLRIDRPAFPAGPYDHPDLGIVLTNHGSEQVTVTGLNVQSGDINDPVFIFDRGEFTNLVIGPNGGTHMIPVQFHPEAVGPHELVFGYNNTAGSETETRLYGEGILPKIKTQNYDFGQTVVFDYMTPPNTQTIRISCENWQWEDSVTITGFDINPAGGIAVNVVDPANDGQADYGSEGFVYDESQIDFPLVIKPGQYYEFDAYFIAKKVDQSLATITTQSDAEADVTSEWTGSGISLGIETEGSEAFICYGENATLTVDIENIALGMLTVDSIRFAGIQPQEITVHPADEALFNNGFDLNPSETRTIRFNYNPLVKPVGNIVETTADVIIYNNTLDEPEKTETIKGSVVHFTRETKLTVQERTPVIKQDVVPINVSLNGGDDFAKADVEFFDITVNHKPGILQVDDKSLQYNTQLFTIAPGDVEFNKLAGTINIKLTVKQGMSGSFGTNDLDLVTFYLNTYLPTAQVDIDTSMISAKVEATGNTCIDIKADTSSVDLLGGCVYDLRWVSGTGNKYFLNSINPNPVKNGTVDINFSVALDDYTNIEIYNTMGERVISVVDGRMRAGEYTVQVPVSELSSGVYMIKMNSGPFTESKQMVITK